MSRLLSLAAAADGTMPVEEALVREARTTLHVRAAVLLRLGERERTAVAVAGDVAPGCRGRNMSLDSLAPLADLVDRRIPRARVAAERIAPLLAHGDLRSALLLALGPSGTPDHVLVLADDRERPFTGADAGMAAAVAGAAAAVLARLRAAEEYARQIARQSALTRAAKTLHESLDLTTLLSRICHEAVAILDADMAIVYRGVEEGLQVAATAGCPPELLGYRLAPGMGLAGKVLVSGCPMLTNDYQRIADLPPDSPFARYRASLAMPFEWSGSPRGVLSVGYSRPYRVENDDLNLLETFAELAAVACQNASAQAALAQAARTDGLTGCLNHAALHETLQTEIERAARGHGSPPALVLFDLDDFKQINEHEGHLAGDEVLRRVGHALSSTSRPYDAAARYGGDEFALVVVGVDEATAHEIAARMCQRLEAAITDVAGGGGVTAGVAAWSPGVSATQLIARADHALLHGKHAGGRGAVVRFSTVPTDERRPRFGTRAERGLPAAPAMPEPASWPQRAPTDERLAKRTRQLWLANALGARLAAMTDPHEIVDAAVDELHQAFGYFLCSVIRIRPDDYVEATAERGEAFMRLGLQGWRQHRDLGLIGRCLRERRPVLCNDVRAEPGFVPTAETQDVRSELVVPLWVAGELWGALNLEEIESGAFDEDDVRLVETVADQAGAALRSAFLYEQLERAYIGTAEALAAALEAKDAYTANHARSIVDLAETVGRRLGMTEAELRDLRLGAVFHDIGKIAVPEAILNKRGPLTAEERRQIERHTVVGEQILAPVEFLAGVRPLVRHEHERWDGAGYPDGLAGETIPLGARIILACDAYHAMTSDRPYRAALPVNVAREELRRHAGTQFDPRVVDSLLELLETEFAAAPRRRDRLGAGAPLLGRSP